MLRCTSGRSCIREASADAVRQVSYVVHRLPACLFPFSAGLRGGCLADDGNASYGVEATALRKAFEQTGCVDQGMAFVGFYPSVPFLDKGTVRKAAEGAVRPLSLRFRPDRLQQGFLVRLHGQKVMCLLLQYCIDDGLLGSDVIGWWQPTVIVIDSLLGALCLASAGFYAYYKFFKKEDESKGGKLKCQPCSKEAISPMTI